MCVRAIGMVTLLACDSRGAGRRVLEARQLYRCALAARGARDTLPDALMGARMVEVADVFPEGAVQMGLTQDQDVVQAFSSQAAEKAFADGVCLRRAEGD